MKTNRVKVDKENYNEDRRKDRTKNAKKRNLWLIFVLVFVILMGSYYVYHTVNLLNERKVKASELIAIKKEKKKLQNELKHINKDEYIELEARNRLRMIRDGEILYLFEDEEKE